MGEEGGVVSVCVSACVYAEQKVGQRLAACVLLLLLRCVFGRNSMFYSDVGAVMSPVGS